MNEPRGGAPHKRQQRCGELHGGKAGGRKALLPQLLRRDEVGQDVLEAGGHDEQRRGPVIWRTVLLASRRASTSTAGLRKAVPSDSAFGHGSLGQQSRADLLVVGQLIV